jgi:hypothetical protein
MIVKYKVTLSSYKDLMNFRQTFKNLLQTLSVELITALHQILHHNALHFYSFIFKIFDKINVLNVYWPMFTCRPKI